MLFDLGHQRAAPLAGLDVELRGADLVAPLAPLDPQLLERPHAAFVARAAGLDPLANPDFFLGQLLVEQRVLLFLGRQRRFLAHQERRVVARPVEQPAAVDLENPRGQRLQERAVVRHEQQRRRPAAQEIFQPADRVDVEMVRRLVEQQHVRLGDQRPRQQHAPLHAGRERAHFQLARPGSSAPAAARPAARLAT